MVQGLICEETELPGAKLKETEGWTEASILQELRGQNRKKRTFLELLLN